MPVQGSASGSRRRIDDVMAIPILKDITTDLALLVGKAKLLSKSRSNTEMSLHLVAPLPFVTCESYLPSITANRSFLYKINLFVSPSFPL